MDSCILFSLVGGYDPIAGDHDGALLHICRKYRPEKVYCTFLTKWRNAAGRMTVTAPA